MYYFVKKYTAFFVQRQYKLLWYLHKILHSVMHGILFCLAPCRQIRFNHTEYNLGDEHDFLFFGYGKFTMGC